MNRIIILLFSFIAFSSFAQTEIWGLHTKAHGYYPQVLFTIDSATNKYNFKHGFSNNSLTNHHYMQAYFDSTDNYYLFATNEITYKFDAVTGIMDYQYSAARPLGNPIMMPNGFLYVRDERGISKINPETLEIETFCYIYNNINSGDTTISLPITEPEGNAWLSQVDDRYCIWAQDFQTCEWIGCIKSFIFLIDTQTDSIIELERFSDEGLSLNGNVAAYNGKYYLNSSQYGNIYSYDIETRSFDIEINIPQQLGIEGTTSTGNFYKGPNNKLYGMVKAGELQNAVLYLYSYSIPNGNIDSIAQIPNPPANIYNIVFDGDSVLYFNYRTENNNNESFDFFLKHRIGSHTIDSVTLFPERKSEENQKSSADIEAPVLLVNGKLTGFLNKYNSENKSFEKILYSFDPHSRSFDTLFIEPTLLPEENTHAIQNSYYPPEFFQLPNNNLIYFEFVLNSSTGELIITIHEFDLPNNKSYISKYIKPGGGYNFISATIFQFNESSFLVTEDYKSDAFIINYPSNTVEPVEINGGLVWQKDNDSTLLGWDNRDQCFVPHIMKFNLNTHQTDTVWNYPPGIHFSQIQTASQVEYYILSSNEIKKINSATNEFVTVFDNDDFGEDYIIIYWFKYLTNRSLIIRLRTGKYFFLINYNLESKTYSILNKIKRPPGNKNENFPFFNPSLIETYEENGNQFIVDQSNSTYSLYKIDIQNNLLIKLDEIFSATTGLTYNCFLKKSRRIPINYWTGRMDSDWFNHENWSQKYVPSDSSSAFIYGHTENNPVIDSIVSCKYLNISHNGNLTLSPGASLSLRTMDIFGQLILQGNDSKRASLICDGEFNQTSRQIYQFSGIPSTRKLLANPMEIVGIKSSPLFDRFEFNTNDSSWNQIAIYPYWPETNQQFQYQLHESIFEFQGKFKNESQTLEIPKPNKIGLYPLPNPFSSSFDWDLADLSSLTHKALYFFDEKNNHFTSYVDGLGNRESLIRPLDAFWVWSNGDESIQLNMSDRIHEANFIAKESDHTFVSLQVSGEHAMDKTVVGFNELASIDFDPDYDAFKFVPSTNISLQIFTKIKNIPFTVNQLRDRAVLDLFVVSGENQTLKLKVADKNNIDFLVLEDLTWHTRINLLEEDYTFDYNKSDGHYPFRLYFEPWALDPLVESDIQLYYYPDFIVVKSRKQVDHATITLYDLAGRAVIEFEEWNFFQIEKPVHVPAGHYIVQLQSEEIVLRKKILVRK